MQQFCHVIKNKKLGSNSEVLSNGFNGGFFSCFKPVFFIRVIFPGVCPFPGAATGTGGRIRDIHATGRGNSYSTTHLALLIIHIKQKQVRRQISVHSKLMCSGISHSTELLVFRVNCKIAKSASCTAELLSSRCFVQYTNSIFFLLHNR